MKIIITLLALILPTLAQAAHVNPEKYYQNKWCQEHHGEAEVTLPDNTRADCITSKNAIEFDSGKKWAEAIGQSLYYSLQTGKRAGVVLILESPADRTENTSSGSTVRYYILSCRLTHGK